MDIEMPLKIWQFVVLYIIFFWKFIENWGKKSCFLDCNGAENRFKRDLLAESRRISQKNRILIMKNNFKRTLFYRRSILTFSTKISFFPISKSSLYNVILTDLDFFINPLLKFSKNKFWKLGEFRFIEMQYLVLWQ